VYLGDQKLPIEVPRVRDTATGVEVPLDVYKALQNPRELDEGMLLRVLKGISCRNYEACAQAVPETFGISASSVSRRFVKASSKKLKQFQERSLDDYDFVALFIDGKSFADEQMVIALASRWTARRSL
jgi:transposase-like protein